VIRRHEYRTREQLAEALAAGVAAVLGGGIAERGSALLAVSGGTTPALFFSRLAEADIDWSAVTVTLVDERIAPLDGPRSNFGLLRRTLLTGRAAAARAMPLFDGGPEFPEAAAFAADRIVGGMGTFDVVVLGMGNDGHTASFFPGGDRLAEALDPDCPRHVVAMRAPDAGEPRLTLTLRRILGARFLALHIEGEEKRLTLDKALGGGPETDMPVRAVLRRAGDELNLFWAP